MRFHFILITILISILVIGLLSGCGPRREPQAQSTFQQEDCEYVVTVLLDLSPSFFNEMTEGGQAYNFNAALLDHYFRERLGTNDQLIIAQISGEKRALLWQGTPLQLRQKFPSATAFGEFLRSNANPNGSLVHDAIAATVDYVLADPNVASGRAKSAIFVLSDMADNGSSEDSEERALDSLKAFGRVGGIVGMYYVDQRLVPDWRTKLKDAGIRESCVEAEIVGTPTLPSFE
ncbi:MAG: hypothetical protein KDA93_23970 [Planctomycetaceae bacterium]|nr:hypothetical protein [Planctomycetaceae bacterium]